MPAAVTPIRPELAQAEITRWLTLTDPVGKYDRTTWDALFTTFSRVVPFRGDDHGGWSAAVFDGDRRAKSGVIRVTAAVLDYDGTASIDRAIETWAGHFGLLHTSKKHRDDAPRFRVILPLRRPVSAFEWDILWQRLQEHCAGSSDPQAKDASRFWYTPGIIDGGEFVARRLEGQMLDPDVWLRKPPKMEPKAPRREERPASTTDAEERARKYIAKMPHAISGQKGHLATWAVAIVCARGFSLDHAATMRLLREHNESCEPRWTEKELEHKASDAADASVPLGYLLKDRPGWTPPSSYYDEPAPVNEDGEVIEYQDELPPDPQEAEQAPARAPRTMAELLGDVLEKAKSGLRDVGVSTCHGKLDRMLAGFRPRMITVLGARTSFGKSSYAIMVTDEALRRGDGVLLISAEDGESTYGQRFMARRARVNSFRLRANTCRQDELERMEKWTMRAETSPFFVDAVGKSAEWIANTIREHCKRYPTKLVVLDYLQRISSTKRTQDRRTEVTQAMGVISDAVKESNAAGLFLSQLKRLDGTATREPTMHDLKESGDIENMAEHIILGWLTEETQAGAAPLRHRYMKVEKNKDGPVDTRAIMMTFEEATASFSVVADDEEATTEFDDHFEDPIAARYP